MLCTAPAAAGPPFAVDDPGTVEERKGTLLLRYELVRNQGVDTQSVPAATLTLGLPAKLELALDGAILKSEAADAPSPGFGDLSLFFKWRFLEEDRAVPAVAVVYKLQLPTGKDGLSGEAIVHSPYLTLGWQLDEKWQVFGNFGVSIPDRGADRTQFFAGAALGYQATESWLIGVDVLGNTRVSDAQRSDLSMGLATQLDLSESWTLMARVGRSISGTQGVNAFVGIQWNF